MHAANFGLQKGLTYLFAMVYLPAPQGKVLRNEGGTKRSLLGAAEKPKGGKAGQQ